MNRISLLSIVLFGTLLFPIEQAIADCSELTEASSSNDAATVARVSFDPSCPKPLTVSATVATVDGSSIAKTDIPFDPATADSVSVDLATWVDSQSRAGVYSISWQARLSDGSTAALDQLFTVPCSAPPAVTQRLLPGSNRLVIDVPTGDVCQGDTVAILNLLDVAGNAVGEPMTQTFPSAAGKEMSFDLSGLEGERRYTGLLSMRNDSGETTESEFSFLTGCGPLQATGDLDGPRITGTLTASSCHFPVSITVRVLSSDGQEIKSGQADLSDRDFDLMLPDYEQWAAGEYSVVADFVSAEGRRSSLNLDAQVECQPPVLSEVSIDATSDSNQAMLLAQFQSTDACQGESEINIQLRNTEKTVVFNRTLKQRPSLSPVPLSFPLNAVAGSTYDLVATLRYGSLLSEETVITEKLFFDCTDPAILDFGYSSPDSSGLGALIRLSSCNLPATAKIQVSEPSGRIVASNEAQLSESPNGPYAVVPEASIRHLPTGKYSARLVFVDNQSRSLTEELDIDRDIEGPSIVFRHQDQAIDENTIPTVARLEDLSVSYSDPSSLLPSSIPYSDKLASLNVDEAHSAIREISGESGAELWFSGYVEIPRSVEDWGYVGVLVEDSQSNRWLLPVTRRFVPIQNENLTDFHPSNNRSGFRSVVRTSSLSPGSYRVLGVMVSIAGRELLAKGQAPFNISSFSARQTNAVLRRGVTENQLTLDFQTTETAVFNAVSAIPDGSYSLEVTGQDRYGNSSEPRILVFNFKQEKDDRLVNLPAIAGNSALLDHQFISTVTGRPYDRPVRIVVKRVSGAGAIKINDRTVDSQIIEFLASPSQNATFRINLEMVTSAVDARYVLQPDSPELRPLQLSFTSYQPDFDLVREDTPTGETLTVSNRSSSCSRFSVFSNLSELNVAAGEVLCALRISHPSIRVTKTTSMATTLEWSTDESLDIPYEIGFVRTLGSNTSFHRVSEHSLADLRSLSLSPVLDFEQSASLKERGRGLVTRTGQFRPGSIVVRAEKRNAIIEVNGQRPFAPLSVGSHRLPLETDVSSVGDTQRLDIRAFYEASPEHVSDRALTFVAVPPPVDVSAVKAELVYPKPLFIDFRVDAGDSDYHPELHGGYEVRQALVFSRDNTNSEPQLVTASLTDSGLIHVALPSLHPGSYRIQLTIANADVSVAEHLLPVVSDSTFEVLDGAPIRSQVFTFRSSDSVPFLGHLALDLEDRHRVYDLSTTVWEISSDGKRYQRFQQGPSAIDFALREPSARYFRARLVNRHSQADFVTDPIKVSAYSQTYLAIEGPHQTFRGWPIELKATGVDPDGVVWRVTPPGGDSPEERTGPSITIDPGITGQYFIEAIATDPAYGPDAVSSQRVFKTVDVQWPKIPPALISGPTRLELGRSETFKVSHPPIFDGDGNTAIRRVGEWELPNGDVVPDQEWVEYTLEGLPEGETYANVLYHAWVEGARDSTLITAVHRVKPYSYRWPEWEIHAETISMTLPSVYRLSVRPTEWRQWFDTSDTPIQTTWQLPGQARVRHRTDRELIVQITQDRSFTARATVTDARGNVSEIKVDNLHPVRTLPFDVATRIVPERSLHTAPIKVEASIEAILLPDDRPVTRVAYYLNEFYAGATDGGPIQLEIRAPGEHRIRAIASVGNEYVAEDTVLFDVSDNLPAICNIQPVGDFSLNGVAKADCEDPDGQMVEYRWYLNGQLINATGSRVQLDRRQIQEAAELSLIAIDNAGKESTARYLPEVGG